jgi:hypothetical protein
VSSNWTTSSNSSNVLFLVYFHKASLCDLHAACASMFLCIPTVKFECLNQSLYIYIITDLINELLGKGSANTVQQETIEEESVFSMGWRHQK